MKRLLLPIAALAAGAVAMPGGAVATTGIEVTIPIKVTITDRGVVFKPAVHKLHPDTDTTYQVRVVNRASRKHSFRIGYRVTRRLAKGASEEFYFTFHTVGKVRWGADNAKAPAAKGTFDVKLAKGFSGG